MTSDINDRGKGDPAAADETFRASSGPAFGAGSERLPGAANLGQDPAIKPGSASEPGGMGRSAPLTGGTSDRTDRSETASTSARAAAHDDTSQMGDALKREASAAKDAAQSAKEGIKEGAAGLAASAKERLAAGVEEGKEQATSSLGDFAAAVRKASDELGQRDQSMAANLMREVASGIEQASNSIHGHNVQDIGRSIAGFARRQPTTFLIGATLAGIALGRLARATGDHANQQPSTAGSGADRRPGQTDPSASLHGSRVKTFPDRSSSAGMTSATSPMSSSPAATPPVTPSPSAATWDRPSDPATSSTIVEPAGSAQAPGSASSAGDRNVR